MVMINNSTVYRLDYRGHGKSDGKRGHINDWEELREDMHRYTKFIQEVEIGKDIFFFSNGGISFARITSHHIIPLFTLQSPLLLPWPTYIYIYIYIYLSLFICLSLSLSLTLAGGLVVLDFLLRNVSVSYGIKGTFLIIAQPIYLSISLSLPIYLSLLV